MQKWLYENKEITEESIPEDAVGFVYRIEHKPSGKFYIGKKILNYTVKKPPLKGKKRRRVVVKPSDWETYHSSSDWIREQVKLGRADDFKRTIIQFCTSKKSLSYYELYWQMKCDVLADPNSLNGNLLGKFYRKDI